MFPRVVTTKRGGNTYRYLALLESYREGDKVKQRTVGNLGNIDRYSQEEIRRVIEKLREFLHDEPLGTVHDINTHGVKHFGIPYVVNIFWNRLGLTEVIQSSLKDRHVEIDVALCVKIMVLCRLIKPRSKLGMIRWLKQLYLPELEDNVPEPHHFYRAMDYLIEMKDQLEKHLYLRLTDLLSLKLTLVFYDMTSSYFEGAKCDLADYGYSRDHRPDRKQIAIGLLVTPNGIPIAHDVYAGNTPDKSTVKEALARLQQTYNVKECVFVGDRGMITDKNLAALKDAGYKYILGFNKRGREVAQELLEEHQNLSTYSQADEYLWYKKIRWCGQESEPDESDEAEYQGDIRYIICYNPAKASDDKEFREQALAEAEEQLKYLQESLASETPKRGRKMTSKRVMLKVAEILKRKGTTAFFEVSYDGQKTLSFQRNEAAIERETLRDGKFLIKTNALLPTEEVVKAYKNLMRVENAFREIKDFIRLRPIYHYNDDRVKAHVMICVLAYLFEQWLEVNYHQHLETLLEQADRIPIKEERDVAIATIKKSRLSGRRILEALDEIKAVEQEFVGKRIYALTKPTDTQKKLLDVFEVPMPPKVLIKD